MSSYIQIASQTTSSSVSEINFNSIPSTLNNKNLRDLVLVVQAVGTSGGNDLRFQINGSSSNIYNWVLAKGDGSTPQSSNQSNVTRGQVGESAKLDEQQYGIFIVQFLDFTATDKHKSILSRAGRSENEMMAQRWANTSAITSLRIFVGGGFTINANSTFTLYGIEG